MAKKRIFMIASKSVMNRTVITTDNIKRFKNNQFFSGGSNDLTIVTESSKVGVC